MTIHRTDRFRITLDIELQSIEYTIAIYNMFQETIEKIENKDQTSIMKE
jgi:hypothetical protein